MLQQKKTNKRKKKKKMEEDGRNRDDPARLVVLGWKEATLGKAGFCKRWR